MQLQKPLATLSGEASLLVSAHALKRLSQPSLTSPREHVTIRSHMGDAGDSDAVWRALADPTRRQVLDLLRDRPRTTGQLDEFFAVSRYAVMKHLRVLEEADLVVVRRRGRLRWNHLNPVPIQRVHERWIRPYEARWATALTALQRHVEGDSRGETAMSELGSIHIEAETVIAASPRQVWRALTTETAAWWGVPYQRGSGEDIVLDARPGGLLLERWADGGGAVWGTVTAVRQDQHLEIEGSIGMVGPVAGVVRINLDAQGEETVVRLSHEAVGKIDDETQRSYSKGWDDLLGVRLKAFVEDGTRYGVGHEPPVTAPTFS